MTKYIVSFYSFSVRVEAENEVEAEEKAREFLYDGEAHIEVSDIVVVE